MKVYQLLAVVCTMVLGLASPVFGEKGEKTEGAVVKYRSIMTGVT